MHQWVIHSDTDLPKVVLVRAQLVLQLAAAVVQVVVDMVMMCDQ